MQEVSDWNCVELRASLGKKRKRVDRRASSQRPSATSVDSLPGEGR